MLPLPDERIPAAEHEESGFDIDFEVVDWGAMLVAVRNPPDAPAGKGVDAINCSLSYIDPSSLYRYHHHPSFSPANWNWGHFTNPKIDELMAEAQETFVPAERDKVLAEAHELIVDEAPWVWIVHDLNPRAMSAKVKGFRRRRAGSRTSPPSAWTERNRCERPQFLPSGADPAHR